MSGGGITAVEEVTFVGGPHAGERHVVDLARSASMYFPDGWAYDVHRILQSDNSINYIATPVGVHDPLSYLLQEYLRCLKDTSAPCARRR